ncbi:MAG: homocysteine S-methyltransferase family protein [Sphingomonas sp.]|jgi:S-methylmethionine-dependent homocysteine/selenocysteine methylase|uniref:homocysteine S-methyltransferase family protein n=1 Tax=Sphingomonas sp. TaxID=28214 RepID=UPI003566E678
MDARFATPEPGVLYLTEGGQETEIMYKFGYDLPHFAMFTLLDNPAAVGELQGMYRRYLDTAARHGFGALMGGLDYRASPDWAALLGYSASGLAEVQLRCIDFLYDTAAPYQGQLPAIRIAGVIGPRGDAYSINRTITEEESEDYHSAQLETLARTGVDIVSAMTFNSVPEAVGLSRAAATYGLPLSLSFSLDAASRLNSGPSLREAIDAVDTQAGESRPAFYGINCSHPLEFEPALEPGDWILRLRSLRPNAVSMDKIELCQLGHLESGDPADLGRRMGALAARYPHIDVWGGCCGTWETHLDRIAEQVLAARRQ